ncbi:MAG: hydantoinase/oxoprolinase family protein [Proteobacteria bacterium]|nr:hydantoinase/oxoprolinase family protein [Pseudomonadota bacterium]
MGWRVGIDIGGTFTDFALQTDRGLILDKVLSTPGDRSNAVINGLEKLARRLDLDTASLLGRLDAVVHGTTVGDNTLIEGSGALTGLLTTSGFRDEIELRRGFKEDIWDVRLPPPIPLVPRRRRLVIDERVLFDGSVYQELDESTARLAVKRLASQGVESVAVSLLFSFVNPAHELRLSEIISEEMPGAEQSLSHQVLPRAPEFERTSTTVVNAYIGPRVSGYLDRLEQQLRAGGYQNDLLVMQSSGGVMTRDYLRGSPVRVLASGPAGGVVGAAAIAARKDEPDLLCVDMGGTSYDVALVRAGTAPAEAGWNWHHRYLVATPMVKVETLGAGGGSLCSARSGSLSVGPGSAGSDPGPVCYGRGGREPTVTDANLLLGLLSETATFAGGGFQLSREGVEEAMRAHVAGPLGLDVEQAAHDCWRLVNATMTQAVRRATAGRGVDPRELTMLAYGGNGPVFAGVQARALGIKRVLIPRFSPAFSALGALVARPAIDEERALLSPLPDIDLARLSGLWRELLDKSFAYFAAAGFAPGQVQSRYLLNLRYPGQNWSLSVVVHEERGNSGAAFVDAELPRRSCEAFHAVHEKEYGHHRERETPEITGVRLQTSTDVPGLEFGSKAQPAEGPAPVRESRRANLGEGFAETAIYSDTDLLPGHAIEGPAIIEADFTTIVVYPGWRAVVDDDGDYRLEDRA